jgi:MbtH protein
MNLKHHKGEAIMSWGNDETTIFTVIVNQEEQYSLWPKSKDIPDGWKSTGKEGPKPDCLQYVTEVWTDMRPLSLRRTMPEAAPPQSDIKPAVGSLPKADAQCLALSTLGSDVMH